MVQTTFDKLRMGSFFMYAGGSTCQKVNPTLHHGMNTHDVLCQEYKWLAEDTQVMTHEKNIQPVKSSKKELVKEVRDYLDQCPCLDVLSDNTFEELVEGIAGFIIRREKKIKENNYD